ncbi:MAG: LCP family protein [Ruminococcus sp.]|jgi:LCP family protein required for cell wall assembly
MENKKKRRIPLFVKILIPIAVLVLLVGAVFIYAQSKLSKINRVDDSKVEAVDPSEEDFEIDEKLAQEIQENADLDVINPDDVKWNNVDINVMRDKDVVNILLIGQDRREGQGRQRSDSMIICSINKKSNKIILSSVMRDLYVPIPGYSDNRINAAYQFGGMPLLDRVMEESLGIHIDGNIEVDFDGFISAMTEVGNLDIDLNQAEADYLNKNSGGTWNLQAGMNSMTPEQVLAYSRTRYVGNSDWERTDRQRKVLMAAFEKVRGRGITALLNMADRIMPSLTTDMSNTQIMGYIYTVLINGMTEFESYRIPVEGTYTNETLSIGMEVLMPDLKANSEYLQKYIYGANASSGS